MPRSRSWVVLLAHAVAVQAVTFVVRPTVSYRALEIGVSTTWLGVLSASFAVAPLLLAIPSGRLTDRVGERAVMLLGGVTLVCSPVLLLLGSRSVGVLVGGVVLLGVGHLLSVVSEQSLVANRAGAGSHDRAFGHYTFAASAGQVLGPAVIGVVGGGARAPDTQVIFAVGLALAVATLLAAAAMPRAAGRRGERPTGGSTVALLRSPGIVSALFASCIVLAAVDITLVYFPALGYERELSAAAVSALLVTRAAASMVSRLFLGRMSARWGRQRLLVASTVVAAAALLACLATMPLWALLVVVAVAGLGLGVGQPLTMSWLAEAAPEGSRGTAMSLRLAGNRLGQVVIPASIGAAAASTGAGGVLAVTSAALAAAGVVAARMRPPA